MVQSVINPRQSIDIPSSDTFVKCTDNVVMLLSIAIIKQMRFLKSTYKEGVNFGHLHIPLYLPSSPLMISGLKGDAFEGKTLKATSRVLIALRAKVNTYIQ